jgi:hypothetical protein
MDQSGPDMDQSGPDMDQSGPDMEQEMEIFDGRSRGKLCGECNGGVDPERCTTCRDVVFDGGKIAENDLETISMLTSKVSSKVSFAVSRCLSLTSKVSFAVTKENFAISQRLQKLKVTRLTREEMEVTADGETVGSIKKLENWKIFDAQGVQVFQITGPISGNHFKVMLNDDTVIGELKRSSDGAYVVEFDKEWDDDKESDKTLILAAVFAIDHKTDTVSINMEENQNELESLPNHEELPNEELPNQERTMKNALRRLVTCIGENSFAKKCCLLMLVIILEIVAFFILKVTVVGDKGLGHSILGAIFVFIMEQLIFFLIAFLINRFFN